jgi:hypothetical protein
VLVGGGGDEYLYDVLGLYWDWKVRPLPGVEEVQ